MAFGIWFSMVSAVFLGGVSVLRGGLPGGGVFALAGACAGCGVSVAVSVAVLCVCLCVCVCVYPNYWKPTRHYTYTYI